jgi:hypothetical protein
MRCVQLLFPYAPQFLQQSPYTQLVHTLWLMFLQDSLASVDRSQVAQAYRSRNVEGYHIRSNETISWEKPTNLSYKLTIWKWVLQAKIMSNLKGRAKRGKRLCPLRGKHTQTKNNISSLTVWSRSCTYLLLSGSLSHFSLYGASCCCRLKDRGVRKPKKSEFTTVRRKCTRKIWIRTGYWKRGCYYFVAPSAPHCLISKKQVDAARLYVILQ